MTDYNSPVVDLDAVRERREQYKATHAHGNAFACCSAHACAEDVPALLSEINRLNDRIGAAFERLAIDAFDGSYCTTLEDLIGYAIGRYREVCESEAGAADEIARLRAEVAR